VCILLHDVGHLGINYLSNYEEKKKHWVLGARIAGKLFGEEGFLLVAGHSVQSGFPRSRMFLADKTSWLIAPDWWLNLNHLLENFRSTASGANRWKTLVAASLKDGCPNGLHAVYLSHREKKA
jgi:hypothetical protein